MLAVWPHQTNPYWSNEMTKMSWCDWITCYISAAEIQSNWILWRHLDWEGVRLHTLIIIKLLMHLDHSFSYFCSVLLNRYVECTGSAMQALTFFKKLYPKHRTEEIDNSIAKAICYIEDTQNLDGSWYCILLYIIICFDSNDCIMTLSTIHFDS